MIESSLFIRAATSVGVLGVCAGCISSQDLGASEPNDAINAEPAIVTQAALRGQAITLESDINWDVYSNSSLEKQAYLGKAQVVCSEPGIPAGCPTGAVVYHSGGDWGARIEACRGNARWIWAPGITATTAPSESAEYYFVSHVSLPGVPVSARLYLAVDDEAEVIVNGSLVGMFGSTSDYGVAMASQSSPKTLYITSALITGLNTITIHAANGTGSFSGCANCTYQQHPAGVMVCVDVRY